MEEGYFNIEKGESSDSNELRLENPELLNSLFRLAKLSPLVKESSLVIIKRDKIDYLPQKGILMIPLNVNGKDSGQLVIATPAASNKIKLFYDHPKNTPTILGEIENIDNIQNSIEEIIKKDGSSLNTADELITTIMANTKFERDQNT